MSTAPTASPITLDRWEKSSNLAALAALASSGQVTIRPNELIRTTDSNRVYHWTGTALDIVSAPVHHGTVANPAALDGIYRLPSCTRGVHPGDTAFVTSAGCEYRVTSGINATAIWAACTTLPTIPTTPSEVGADPAGTAATAVSTHNTATDSHTDLRELIAGKQNALTISDVGTALLNLSTPLSVQIPRINADGSVTLIDVPEGVGGCSARGLYSGLMSETAPSQASTGLTTWVNQGAASSTDTAVGLQIVNPTTGSDDNIRGLAKPVPATPYTLTALLELASLSGNYPSAHLGWADSASTKTHIVTLCGDGRSGLLSPTGYSSWSFSGAPQFTRDGRRVWLQLSDDGTTITVRWSTSGVYWYTLYSAAKASSHLGASGYNRLFFGASSSGITGVATLLSWSFGTANLPGSIVGHVVFKGQWDASSNDPALPDASESKGFYYITSAAGTYGGIDYEVGDWCISDGTTWGKVDNSDAITSFAGRTGAILPIASDYSAFYLGISAQAADSAMLGGQLPSYFAPASHAHTQDSINSTAGWITDALAGKQPTITAGTTSQYYRGDKTFQDFATSVRAAVLTGLNTSKLSSREVLSTDSLLSAIGLLQGQLTSIVEQNYYAQAGDTKLEIPLSYTGTGTGVLALRLLSDIAQTATIDGAGKFYSDSAGTLNESTSFVMSANAWTVIYIRVPSGTCSVTIPNGYAIRAFGNSANNLVTETNNGPKINGLPTSKIRSDVLGVYLYTQLNLGILSGQTYPWLNATSVYFSGNALTVSGVTYHWLNATSVYFSGNAITVSGVTYPWVNATQVYFVGDALTVSGVTYPWVNATQVYFIGNAITVSGQTYPWLNATSVYFSGNALTVSGVTYPWVNATRVILTGNALTITANISTSALYSGAGSFDLYIGGTGISTTYATSRAWPANISRIYLRPSVGSMPSADVDRLFNDLAATPGLTAVGSKVLDLRGNCGAVTAASATARANLAAKGFTVSFNV